MNIVGPLLKTQSGKRFILVVCDHATQYPEAVALRSTEAEDIAEQLVQIFTWVGVVLGYVCMYVCMYVALVSV